MQITSSLDLTRIHIDAIRQSCIKHVEFHQPIPEYVLEEAKAALPAEWLNETTTASPVTSTKIPDILNTITTDTLKRLEEIDCSFDCNGNGECQNGMFLRI